MKITLKTNQDSTCLFIGEKEYTKFIDMGDFNFETNLNRFCITSYPIHDNGSGKIPLPVSGIFTVNDGNLKCNSSHFKIEKNNDEYIIKIDYPSVFVKEHKKQTTHNLYNFTEENDNFAVLLNNEPRQLSLTKNNESMVVIDNFIDYELDGENKEIKVLTTAEKTTSGLKGLVVVYSLKSGIKLDEFYVAI